MSWQKEVDELQRRNALAERMGGEEKISRQKAKGKLTARERIAALLDEGSFHEVGKTAGQASYSEAGELLDLVPTNFLLGRGRIEGRPVVIGVDDTTVRGGAADAVIAAKQVVSEQMAFELRLPLIRMIDDTGSGGSVKSLDSSSTRTDVPRNLAWNFVVANLNQIPVVSLVLGPVAGWGAARAVTSHYSVMVKQHSQLFVAGPPLVNRRTPGEPLDNEGLGGAKIHTRSGAIDDEADNEMEAMARARRFLSYLPASVHELPARGAITDDAHRTDDSLLTIVPRDRRKVYKMRTIVESVVDRGSFFEIGKFFGRSLITGLARLDGWPVALMAGDPYHFGGGWNADAAQKAMRFVDLAETFHLPVVHLVDNSGLVIGRDSEKNATIRHGARALAAIYQAKVPWCSVLIRKAFGLAGAAHSNAHRYQYRYAWPSGDWGSLPTQGDLDAAYQSLLEQSKEPEKLLAEITERMNRVRSPFRTADAFLVEEIIDPRSTRPLLCEFANLAAPLRRLGPSTVSYRP